MKGSSLQLCLLHHHTTCVWLQQAFWCVAMASWSCLAGWMILVLYPSVVLGLALPRLVLRFTASISTCDNVHLDEIRRQSLDKMYHAFPPLFSCLGVEPAYEATRTEDSNFCLSTCGQRKLRRAEAISSGRVLNSCCEGYIHSRGARP